MTSARRANGRRRPTPRGVDTSSAPRPLWGERDLLSLRDVPNWMRDNPYIETHYRAPQTSTWTAIRLAFIQVHNETGNVWTHFLGAVFFLYTLCMHLPHLFTPIPTVWDTSHLGRSFAILRHVGLSSIPVHPSPEVLNIARAEAARTLIPLLVAAVYCLSTSTVYHAAWVRSPRALSILSRADFSGIALLCAGHTMSGVRALFFCDPHRSEWTSAIRVCSAISAIAAVVTARCVLIPGFGGRHAHKARSLAFTILGAFSAAPVIIGGIRHGWGDPEFVWMARYIYLSILCYVVGMVLYATRIPECCRPGKHDVWCSSHQFMHILVIAGAYSHYAGISATLEHRLQNGCVLSPLVAH